MKNLIIDGVNHGEIARYYRVDDRYPKSWCFDMVDGKSFVIACLDIRNWNPTGGDAHNDYEIETYPAYYQRDENGYRYKIVFRDSWFRIMRTKNDRTTYGKRYSKECFDDPCEAYQALRRMELTFR